MPSFRGAGLTRRIVPTLAVSNHLALHGALTDQQTKGALCIMHDLAYLLSTLSLIKSRKAAR